MSIQVSERLRLGSDRPSTYDLMLAINVALREITAKMSEMDKRLTDSSSGSKTTEKAKDRAASSSPVPGATIATGTVLGRSSLRDGPVEVIRVGEGLLLESGTLSAIPTEPEEPVGNGSEAWFTSEEVALPTVAGEAGRVDVEHGLGGRPPIVFVWLKCIADDAGWLVGDVVDLASVLVDNGANRVPYIVHPSDTLISLILPGDGGVSISSKTGSGGTTFTPASWVAIIEAHLRSSSELDAFEPALSPGFQ